MTDVIDQRLLALRQKQQQLENQLVADQYVDEYGTTHTAGGLVQSRPGSSASEHRPSSAPQNRRSSSAVPKPTSGFDAKNKKVASDLPSDPTRDDPTRMSSRKAMLSRYFNAMSEFPDYDKRRKDRLNNAQPFSFDLRESKREKSTSRRRFEEENERREMELQSMLTHQFKANPVPPSTFLHKYELMVQEWCARKQTSQTLAQDRARRIQEEALPAKRYAEGFQKTKKDSFAARRAASAQAERDRRFRKDFKAREVPIDVKLPKWEEMCMQEQDRGSRVRLRADQLLAMSARPPRMEQAEQERRLKEEVLAIEAQQAQQGKGKRAASPATLDARARAVVELQQRNPNFTFQPNVKTSVPDYEYLWAKDRVEAMKRKQSRPPTVSKEFSFHQRSNSSNAKAKAATEAKRDAQEGKETRWPYMSTKAKVKPTPPPKNEPVDPPRGTHAQELKAEMAFKRILSESEAQNQAAKEKMEREEKQRAVNKRMAPFFEQQRQNAGPSLEERIKEKKAQMRRQNAEAKQKIVDLEAKVRDEPPLFMEPSHFDAVAKARAATEDQVLSMLKEHGLAEKTLNAIMTTADVSAMDVPANQTASGNVTAPADEKSLVQPQNNISQVVPAATATPVPAAASAPPATATVAAPEATKPAHKRTVSSSSGSSSSSSSSDSYSSSFSSSDSDSD